LTEDASIRSGSTSILNGEVGYRLGARYRIVLDAYNLLNARASDIDYFYTSRLPGEPPDGVDDRHFHPAVPRTVRATLQVSF
jgi:outer membrane receptor protein involved in Fe transport